MWNCCFWILLVLLWWSWPVILCTCMCVWFFWYRANLIVCWLPNVPQTWIWVELCSTNSEVKYIFDLTETTDMYVLFISECLALAVYTAVLFIHCALLMLTQQIKYRLLIAILLISKQLVARLFLFVDLNVRHYVRVLQLQQRCRWQNRYLLQRLIIHKQ